MREERRARRLPFFLFFSSFLFFYGLVVIVAFVHAVFLLFDQPRASLLYRCCLLSARPGMEHLVLRNTIPLADKPCLGSRNEKTRERLTVARRVSGWFFLG